MPNLSYLSPKTIVQESPIHGRGLFARAPITQGEIAAIKGGYIFNGATRRAVETRLGPADIPVAEGFYIGPLTAGERDGGMLFSNHSCDPNIGIQGQIVFLALRDIQAGEEPAFPDGELRVGASVNLDSPPRAALGILPDGSGSLACATQAETFPGPRRSGDQAAQVGQRP